MTPEALAERRERFMPDGVPKYVRCYDNGGRSADRYLVVYTGPYRKRTGGTLYCGMNSQPTHPQGIGMMDTFWRAWTHDDGTIQYDIDRPRYSHLGARITFDQLPEGCRKLVINDYEWLWGLAEGTDG